MTSIVEALTTGMTMGINAGMWIALFLEVFENIKNVLADIGSESNNE